MSDKVPSITMLFTHLYIYQQMEKEGLIKNPVADPQEAVKEEIPMDVKLDRFLRLAVMEINRRNPPKGIKFNNYMDLLIPDIEDRLDLASVEIASQLGKQTAGGQE